MIVKKSPAITQKRKGKRKLLFRTRTKSGFNLPQKGKVKLAICSIQNFAPQKKILPGSSSTFTIPPLASHSNTNITKMQTTDDQHPQNPPMIIFTGTTTRTNNNNSAHHPKRQSDKMSSEKSGSGFRCTGRTTRSLRERRWVPMWCSVSEKPRTNTLGAFPSEARQRRCDRENAITPERPRNAAVFVLYLDNSASYTPSTRTKGAGHLVYLSQMELSQEFFRKKYDLHICVSCASCFRIARIPEETQN